MGSVGTQAHLALKYDTGRARDVPLSFISRTSALSNSTFPVVNFLPATGDAQLLNVSNRARLSLGDAGISGFVIGGVETRPVLIRALGRSLSHFGVSPVAQNPRFSIYSGSNSAAFAVSSNWNVLNNTELSGLAGPNAYDAQALGWLFSFAGAFPLEQDANEQVYFGFLSPGAYTVQTSDPSASGTGGWVLTEVYVFPNAAEISVAVPAL